MPYFRDADNKALSMSNIPAIREWLMNAAPAQLQSAKLQRSGTSYVAMAGLKKITVDAGALAQP